MQPRSKYSERNAEVANPGRKQVEEREDDPVATNFAKYMARSEGRLGATKKVALPPAERDADGWIPLGLLIRWRLAYRGKGSLGGSLWGNKTSPESITASVFFRFLLRGKCGQGCNFIKKFGGFRYSLFLT